MDYELILLWLLYWIWWGLTPGPLNLLLINETIRSWFSSGLKISFSPIITDFPIILICIFIYNIFDNKNLFLILISIIWAIYLFFLFFQEFFKKSQETVGKKLPIFWRWALVNFLNPNSYIFWLTIWIAIIKKALSYSYLNLILFFLFFHVTLVWSKILISYLCSKMDLLNNKNYIWINRALAFLMLSYWVYFLIKSYEYF